jgi:hypothetical protein
MVFNSPWVFGVILCKVRIDSASKLRNEGRRKRSEMRAGMESRGLYSTKSEIKARPASQTPGTKVKRKISP